MTENIVKEFSFVEGLLKTGVTYVQTYTWQICIAAVILLIGFFISGRVHKLISKAGTKAKMDKTLLSFLAGLSRFLVLLFTVIVTLSKLGITISPIVAAIGAGIFGASFAIQAPVANYAAGLAIIIIRPFRLDDVLTIGEYCGKVEMITLPMTFLRTEDGEQVQVPNKFIMGEIIMNSGSYRLVSEEVGIEYSSDPAEATELIETILRNTDAVEQEPPFRVGISSFGDSGIIISYRYRIPAEQYHTLQYKINGEVFSALKKADIGIPYPHRVVNINNSSSLS